MSKRTLQGTGVSSGQASGPVFTVRDGAEQPTNVARASVETAAESAAVRLEAVAEQKRYSNPAGAGVLEAQAMMLRDAVLLRKIEELVRSGVQPERAVADTVEKYGKQMEELGDEYLKERAADVREVGRLLVSSLKGSSFSRLEGLSRPSVVVAHELTPLDTLSVEPELLLALVTEVGGRTSHAAIVARELGIPAVVGVSGAVVLSQESQAALVDGDSGRVDWLESVDAASVRSIAAALPVQVDFVELMGNSGSVAAAKSAAAHGARGIGLFRTEFLFLGRDAPVSEEEQLEVYEAVCDACSPHRVVVRTLDIGSDKQPSYIPRPAHEPNPALGHRGIRLWLEHDELSIPQVRALVTANQRSKNVEVMLPMVGAREEMAAARELFEREANRKAAQVPRLGMMVELPSVAVALDTFSGLIEFISLGTNDLTQYAVGADRELEWKPWLGEFNPGVLRLIGEAISTGLNMGVGVGVCGEMAGHPEGAVFLVGAGATSLSMASGSFPKVVRVLTALGRDGCREASQAALKATEAELARSAVSEAIRAQSR